jgi:hypothetical protein
LNPDVVSIHRRSPTSGSLPVAPARLIFGPH